MANTENIQAKLCDYIDGELDEQARLEIEKYLADHPGDRQLIDQLRQTRMLLRELPRESAPAEIAESMQAHLERSVLLDADDRIGAPVLRINRWPRLAAAAAVVLLAGGLGAIVYYAIPLGPPGHGTIARHTEPEPAAPGTGMVDGTSAFDPEVRGLADAADADGLSPSERAEPAPPATRIADAHEHAPMAEPSDIFARDELASRTDSDAGEPPVWVIGEDALFATPASPGALFVVVETDDPAAANMDITRFLASNRIAWSELPQPMPDPLELRQTQRVIGSRINVTEGRLRVGEVGGALEEQRGWAEGPRPAPARLGLVPAPTTPPVEDAPPAAVGQAGPPAPDSAPPAGDVQTELQTVARPHTQERPAEDAEPGQDGVEPAAEAEPAVVPAPAPEHPEPEESVRALAAGPPHDDPPLVPADETDRAPLEEPFADGRAVRQYAQTDSDSENFYVARNMTRQQTQELAQKLAAKGPSQRAYIVEAEIVDDAQAAEEWAPDRQALGESLQRREQQRQLRLSPRSQAVLEQAQQQKMQLAQAEQPASPEARRPTAAARIVMPQDLLTIDITGVSGDDESMHRVVRVDEQGRIDLPLIGEVEAAGLTYERLSSRIESSYRRDDLRPGARAIVRQVGEEAEVVEMAEGLEVHLIVVPVPPEGVTPPQEVEADSAPRPAEGPAADEHPSADDLGQ